MLLFWASPQLAQKHIGESVELEGSVSCSIEESVCSASTQSVDLDSLPSVVSDEGLAYLIPLKPGQKSRKRCKKIDKFVRHICLALNLLSVGIWLPFNALFRDRLSLPPFQYFLFITISSALGLLCLCVFHPFSYASAKVSSTELVEFKSGKSAWRWFLLLETSVCAAQMCLTFLLFDAALVNEIAVARRWHGAKGVFRLIVCIGCRTVMVFGTHSIITLLCFWTVAAQRRHGADDDDVVVVVDFDNDDLDASLCTVLCTAIFSGILIFPIGLVFVMTHDIDFTLPLLWTLLSLLPLSSSLTVSCFRSALCRKRRVASASLYSPPTGKRILQQQTSTSMESANPYPSYQSLSPLDIAAPITTARGSRRRVSYLNCSQLFVRILLCRSWPSLQMIIVWYFVAFFIALLFFDVYVIGAIH